MLAQVGPHQSAADAATGKDSLLTYRQRIVDVRPVSSKKSRPLTVPSHRSTKMLRRAMADSISSASRDLITEWIELAIEKDTIAQVYRRGVRSRQRHPTPHRGDDPHRAHQANEVYVILDVSR